MIRSIQSRHLLISSLALFPLLVGCTAVVGAKGVKVPEDSAAQCEQHCESIGMELSAVAIMANNVGCVCERREKSAQSGSPKYASSTAGGMATVIMQEAEAAQQQQQSQSY